MTSTRNWIVGVVVAAAIAAVAVAAPTDPVEATHWTAAPSSEDVLLDRWNRLYGTRNAWQPPLRPPDGYSYCSTLDRFPESTIESVQNFHVDRMVKSHREKNWRVTKSFVAGWRFEVLSAIVVYCPKHVGRTMG